MTTRLYRVPSLAFWAAPLWLLLLVARPAGAIDGRYYVMPREVTNRGSGYTALASGLDGRIYLGSAIYGGGGWLLEFEPNSETVKKVFNAHQITRETGTGLDAQAKFHAKLQVDADGVIWAATKQGNEDFARRPEYGENPTGYPGGHLFSFNPKSREVIDHGILKQQEGVMGGAIDRQRRRLYFWSDPKTHFLIYDIEKNTVTDMGAMGGSPRYIAIDPKGRVFGCGRPGVLWMFDPETDKLSDLAVRYSGPGSYVAPYVIVTGAGGKALYGGAPTEIIAYDLASIRLEAPGKETVPGTNGTIDCRSRAKVPDPVDLHAGAIGKDGCFYLANGQHVLRFNPKTDQCDDLGAITIDGKPLPARSSPQGACVAPDGTLYLKYIYPYSLMRFDKLTVPQGDKR